ncbi:MAG: heme ABC exporter ATP-binding protein CcmA [Thermoplasmatota archaeon]
MTGRALLGCHAVEKRYGRRRILGPLDLVIGAGEQVALTGENGSGKTTLLRLAAGLARPTKGTIDHPAADQVGFAGHAPALYDELTPREQLGWWLRLQAGRHDPDAVLAALAETGLARQAEQPQRSLSRGQRQRVALLHAFLPEPALLLLDEPATALDAAGMDWLEGHLAAARERGAAALLALHDEAQVARWSDRRIHLAHGCLQEREVAP